MSTDGARITGECGSTVHSGAVRFPQYFFAFSGFEIPPLVGVLCAHVTNTFGSFDAIDLGKVQNRWLAQVFIRQISPECSDNS
jgi:hypothetical protein